MIRREVAEALWPEFVARVDALVTEADDFNRELMKMGAPKRKRSDPSPKKLQREKLQNQIIKILDKWGPLNPAAIFAQINDPAYTYGTVGRCLIRMAQKDALIKPGYGLYDIPRPIKKAP